LKNIAVFVVDDSSVMRTTVAHLLEGESDMEIVGFAQDPVIAEEKFIRNGWPDVIILDIEMPKMDGLTFLKKIMSSNPTPVIICSSVAQSGSKNAVDALFLGAVEVIAKPEVGLKNFLEESKHIIINAIRSAYEAKKKIASVPRKNETIRQKKHSSNMFELFMEQKRGELFRKHEQPVVAIGASTGGVQAIERIISSLPQGSPPIVITQHMPPYFTKSLAERLNKLAEIHVKEAENGDKLLQGRALLAPGDKHMVVKKSGRSYEVEIKDGPKVSRHKPSVDVLFRSCASEVGANALGFLLTGMGDDGARGLKEMMDRGAKTYTQEEDSCVVYGMPKAAVNLGASMGALSLEQIVETIKQG